MSPILSFGIQVIHALQNLSPLLDIPMKIFSFFGTIEFYMVFIPLVYWAVDAQAGMRIFMVLITTDFFTASFKLLFRQPRPYWISDVKPLAIETSYGLPSSHSSDSLAVWGYAAWRIKKSWMWIVSIVLILLIAFSRMHLGVHFPTDVLCGWLIGLVVVYCFARFDRQAVAWFKRRTQAGQIWIGFFLSVIMTLVGWLIIRLTAAFPDPAEWASFSTGARSLAQHITLAGAFFGAVAGYVLMEKYAHFQTRGPALQRAGRFLVGIIGVLVLYLGLNMLFDLLAADATLLGYILRYVRYGAVAFWAIFGAPWVFLKLKLAQTVQ